MYLTALAEVRQVIEKDPIAQLYFDEICDKLRGVSVGNFKHLESLLGKVKRESENWILVSYLVLHRQYEFKLRVVYANGDSPGFAMFTNVLTA